MDAGRPRFEADRRERDELADAVLRRASRTATSTGCGSCSPPTSRWSATAAARRPQWARSVVGADNVARVLAAIFPPFVRIGVVVEPHEVNGQPGAIFRDRDGKVVNTWTLDVLDGQIQTIRAVINPDKLGHLGPVADAWAVLREANQARRAAD